MLENIIGGNLEIENIGCRRQDSRGTQDPNERIQEAIERTQDPGLHMFKILLWNAGIFFFNFPACV